MKTEDVSALPSPAPLFIYLHQIWNMKAEFRYSRSFRSSILQGPYKCCCLLFFLQPSQWSLRVLIPLLWMSNLWGLVPLFQIDGRHAKATADSKHLRVWKLRILTEIVPETHRSEESRISMTYTRSLDESSQPRGTFETLLEVRYACATRSCGRGLGNSHRGILFDDVWCLSRLAVAHLTAGILHILQSPSICFARHHFWQHIRGFPDCSPTLEARQQDCAKFTQFPSVWELKHSEVVSGKRPMTCQAGNLFISDTFLMVNWCRLSEIVRIRITVSHAWLTSFDYLRQP